LRKKKLSSTYKSSDDRNFWGAQFSDVASLTDIRNIKKKRMKARRLKKSLTLKEIVGNRVPAKVGLLGVLKPSGKRFETRLVVQQENLLGIFPTKCKSVAENGVFVDGKHHFMKNNLLKSEMLFDLSEPSFEVSVVTSFPRTSSTMSNVLSSDRTFEFNISINRFQGVVLVHFQAATAENRDSWVTNLRSFDSRLATRKNLDEPVQGLQKAKWKMKRIVSLGGRRLKGTDASTTGRKRQVFDLAQAPFQTKAKSKNDEDRTAEIVQVLEERLECDDFLVHVGANRITARQETLTSCFFDFVRVTGIAVDFENAREFLKRHGWNIHNAMHAIEDLKHELVTPSTSKLETQQERDATNIVCQICFDEFGDDSRKDGLICGHAFCVDCWTGYVSSQIEEGTVCLTTICMKMGCNAKAGPEFMKKHANSEQLRQRFERIYSSSFVESCNRVRWCPRSECGNAVEWKVEEVDDSVLTGRTVRCACGFQFCFDCGRESHSPATCSQIEAWNEAIVSAEEAGGVQAAPRQEQREAMAKRWILKNSRPCPSCKAPIEKTEGCNHMVCSSCRHEFCWACFDDWATHGQSTGGFFRCNKYEDRQVELHARHEEASAHTAEEYKGLRQRALEEREKHADEELAYRNAQSLRKRVFYFLSQHDHHKEGFIWALEILEVSKNRQQSLLSPQQREFIPVMEKVLRLIMRCRQVLRWAQIVSYFMNSPEISGEWVFMDGKSIREMKTGLPLQKTIDTTHRSLFLARMSTLEENIARLQRTLEGPAIAYDVFDMDKVLNNQRKGRKRKKDIKKTSKGSEIFNEVHSSIRELERLSCSTLDSMHVFIALLEEIQPMFKFLRDPAATGQQPRAQGKQEIIIIPVQPSIKPWLCSLCSWRNPASAEKCLMCTASAETNVFARYRNTLFQQVRKCAACSADIKLNQRYETPANLVDGSTENRFGEAAPMNGGRQHVLEEDLVGPMKIICPECDRNAMEMKSPRTRVHNDADDEHELSALFQNGSGDEEGDDSGKAETGTFLCPWGHELNFDSELQCANECDACSKSLSSAIGVCLRCNWTTCKPCAHLHGYLCRTNTSTRQAKRERRNAVHFTSPESFRNRVTQAARRRGECQQLEIEDANGWPCSRCTFWNASNSRTRCEMCDGSREIPEEDAEDDEEEEEEENRYNSDDESSMVTVEEALESGHLILSSSSHRSRTSRLEADVLSPRSLFIKRSQIGNFVYAATLKSSAFISESISGEKMAKRHLTLLKPIRRDHTRLLEDAVLLDRHIDLEIWWETNCIDAKPFDAIIVILRMKQDGALVHETKRKVPNSGICNVKIPPLDLNGLYVETGKPLSLTIHVEACDQVEHSDELKAVLTVCSVPLHFKI